MDFTRQNVSQLAPAWPTLRSDLGDQNLAKCPKIGNRFLISSFFLKVCVFGRLNI